MSAGGGVLARLAALEHEIRLLRLRVTSEHGGGVPAAPHATEHYDGGDDEVDVTQLGGFPGGSPVTYLDSNAEFTDPSSNNPHAETHYDGESDEVDVTQLGGFPGGSPVTYLDSDGTFSTPDGGGGGSFSGALVKKAADQTGANYTAGPAIAFDAEAYDVGGWHDNVTNNTRLTVPSGVNYVVCSASITLGSVTSSQWALLYLFKNGDNTGAFNGACAQLSFNDVVVTPTISFSSVPIPVTAGDYFEVGLLIESDTAIDITASRGMFSIMKVG